MQLQRIIDSTKGSPAFIQRAAAYRSRMLEKYLWFLAKCEEPQVLDIGPVCSCNVSFFLNHVKKLFIFDLIRALDYSPHNVRNPEKVLSLLDYEEESLDGIHLWDLADHLDDAVLSRVIDACSRMLRPNGLLLMISSNSATLQPYAQFLTSGNDFMATPQQSEMTRLPFHHRPNRDMQAIMLPLEQYCSFLNVNGLREFLFRRGVPDENTTMSCKTARSESGFSFA